MNLLNCSSFTDLKCFTGAFDLEAAILRIGGDYLVAIWGGEKPHIGAVAAAQSGFARATASVICFPTHKEDEVVRMVSEKLADALDANVVVTAGMHWDNISKEGIGKVMDNTKILAGLILIALSDSVKILEGEF